MMNEFDSNEIVAPVVDNYINPETVEIYEEENLDLPILERIRGKALEDKSLRIVIQALEKQ